MNNNWMAVNPTRTFEDEVIEALVSAHAVITLRPSWTQLDSVREVFAEVKEERGLTPAAVECAFDLYNNTQGRGSNYKEFTLYGLSSAAIKARGHGENGYSNFYIAYHKKNAGR